MYKYQNVRLFIRDQKFYRTVLYIAIPVVLQTLITSGVNMMDTLMLSSCGELQLSASSLANQFIMLFQFMCNGIGFGAAVLTAQYFGAQDNTGIKHITTIMLRVGITLSLFFTVVTYFFPREIMSIYTPNETIIDFGVKYFKISAFTYLLFAMSQTVTAVLRTVHQVKLPLYTSIVTFVVNVFFNWVLIFGKLGAPAMEIEGAAWGTLIARVAEFSIIIGYFLFFDQTIRYKLKDLLLPCKAYMVNYIHYCIPVLISDTLLGLGNNMVSVIMGHISAAFVAAYAVVSQVSRMATVLTQGVSNSSSVMIGNTLGEGKKELAYRQGITFLMLSIGVGVLASGLILVICPIIMSFGNLQEETREIAAQMIYAICITTIFSSVQSILTKGVLRGAGDTKFLMIADMLFLWVVSIPLGYLTGIVWQLPAFIVCLALRADWIVKSTWCSVRLLKGKWTEKGVRVERNKS